MRNARNLMVNEWGLVAIKPGTEVQIMKATQNPLVDRSGDQLAAIVL